MTTRRGNVPAYYLGRPAALWLAALTPAANTRRAVRTGHECAGPGLTGR